MGCRSIFLKLRFHRLIDCIKLHGPTECIRTRLSCPTEHSQLKFHRLTERSQLEFHRPTERSRSALLFTCCFLLSTSYAQSSFFNTSDSLNTKRSIGINTLYAGVWSSSLVMLDQAWYKDYPKTTFHTFNDASEWLQMDKCGHAFTTYQISKSLTSLYRWTGMKPKNAVLAGTAITLGYQASIEYLDGRSVEWGFSWSDITANFSGGLLFGLQQYYWDKQFILFKESYSPSIYAPIRPNTLGNNFAERYLKDYNGQTYWLSFAPKNIWKTSNIPAWMLISFGYSVDAKLVGDKNTYTTVNNIIYNASREFLFSFDIDLSKLPIKRKWVKNILRPINAIKIPLPTLHWKNGVCYAHPLYF